MTTVVELVCKRVSNTEETRAFIKICTKLGLVVMQIFTKSGEVYRSDKVSNKSVHRRGKKYLNGTVRQRCFKT